MTELERMFAEDGESFEGVVDHELEEETYAKLTLRSLRSPPPQQSQTPQQSQMASRSQMPQQSQPPQYDRTRSSEIDAAASAPATRRYQVLSILFLQSRL